MFGRWVTSNPSSPSPSSAALRALWRSVRRSGGTQPAHQGLQGQEIALGPEAGYHPQRQVGDHRVSPLRLPREDVGEVELDKGNPHGEEGIAERQTRVRQ